jgi:uncharacterized protein
MADAYKLAIDEFKESGDDIKTLAREQKSWERSRDKCGSDQKCILDTMRKRLDALSAPAQ